MKLIIEIPETIVTAIQNGKDYRYDIHTAIAQGLPYRDTTYGEFKERTIELFNKYDVLLVHMDGRILPVRNTSKQECYNLLYEIQELIDWRKVLFKKYHGGVDNG